MEDAPNAGDESHDEEVVDSEAGDEDEVDGLGDGSRLEKELTRDSRVSCAVDSSTDREKGHLRRATHAQILSLHAPYGTKLGAAFYDDEKRVLHVLEDTKDTVGWDLATLRELLSSQWCSETADVQSWSSGHRRWW